MNKAWLWVLAGGLALGLLLAGGLRWATRPPAPTAGAAFDAETDPEAGAEAATARSGDAATTTASADATAARTSGRPARRRAPTPFAPGETLVYDVAWTLVNAGTLTLALDDDPDAGAYRIRASAKVAEALARLYPLDYQAETQVDPDTLLPRRATVHQQEGGRRRTRVTVFDHAARRAHFEQLGGRQADLDIPADARDALGALYALRAAPELAPGAHVSLPVCDSGRLYTADASVGRAESIETPAGRFDAWRVTPVIRNAAGEPQKAAVSVWLSSDRRRLPVRLELELAVGRFAIVLREARAN